MVERMKTLECENRELRQISHAIQGSHWPTRARRHVQQ